MKTGGVRSVQRAIEILELLASRHEMTISQIAREMDIPKASAYQIVSTLVAKRLVAKASDTAEYVLGPYLFTLGSHARMNMDVVQVAAPYLKALNESLDETVHLTILRDGALLYVDSYESTKRLRTHSSIGEIGELHCTAVGKAMLAFQPETERRRLIGDAALKRFTPNTITDPNLLIRELDRVSEMGYSVDNIEHEDGVRCIAAPIRDHSGRVSGSVSVSGPAGRITPESDAALSVEVTATARDISRALGYRNS